MGLSETTNIAAVVLAAGRSTRMGAANKLTADIGGTPMGRRVAEAALASAAALVLVVTGHQAGEVRAALAGLRVTFVDNADYAAGLSASLKAGVAAVPATAEAALVLLGDMPRVTSAHLDRLIAAFAAEEGAAIVVPTHAGRRGNPVVWPRTYFAEMLQLEGDAGAKRLMAAHASRVREVDLGTDAILVDVDTPDALAAVRGGCHPGRSAERGEPGPSAKD
jgi:molybdenum cofactor cytidylyltransferase